MAAAHSPVTKAQAIAAAEAQASKQGQDTERTARLRVQFLDTWQSRWSQEIPAGKNFQ